MAEAEILIGRRDTYDNGIIIKREPPRLNLDEIYSAVTKILSDKHYAQKLGANGLDRVKKERLDWHRMAREIDQILLEAKE